jgi:hypothetical protein
MQHPACFFSTATGQRDSLRGARVGFFKYKEARIINESSIYFATPRRLLNWI